jgi:hypothetical protein
MTSQTFCIRFRTYVVFRNIIESVEISRLHVLKLRLASPRLVRKVSDIDSALSQSSFLISDFRPGSVAVPIP